MSTEETGARPETRPPYGVPSLAVAIVFGLLYAYVLWEAIGDIILLPQSLAAGQVPWWLLVIYVALPVVVYVLVFYLGRHRRIFERALLFLLGLAILSCATIGSIAYVQQLV